MPIAETQQQIIDDAPNRGHCRRCKKPTPVPFRSHIGAYYCFECEQDLNKLAALEKKLQDQKDAALKWILDDPNDYCDSWHPLCDIKRNARRILAEIEALKKEGGKG